MANTTKADEIALVIEDAILSGDLAPGTVLRQEQLSEELGVSRTPVREALRQVAALGLLSFEPKRGARVRLPSTEEFHDAWLIRAELEGLAAQLAVSRITKDQLRRMHKAEKRFAELTHALRSGEAYDALELQRLTADWSRANAEFHDVILEAAASPLLTRMASSIRRVFHGQPVWPSTPEIDALFASNLVQHAEIRKAFSNGDAAVRELVRRHVLESYQLFVLLLEEVAKQRRKLLPRRSMTTASAS